MELSVEISRHTRLAGNNGVGCPYLHREGLGSVSESVSPRFVWLHPDCSASCSRPGLPTTTITLSLSSSGSLGLFDNEVEALARLPSCLVRQKVQQLQRLFWSLKALDLFTISGCTESITAQDVVSCLPRDCQEVQRKVPWKFRD